MPKPSQKHIGTLLLGLIILIGLVVRLWSLQGESFWLDEAYSFYQARNPFFLDANNPFKLTSFTQRLTFIRHILSDDIHPPFYYGQLGLWSLLGLSDWWMRLNSVLWGVLLIPAVYYLAKKFAPTSAVPLIAASLVAFSPFHVEMSIELRMYGLMAVLAAASIYYLHTLLTNPAPLRSAWIGYTLSNLLMVYSQGVGFLWLVLQGLIYAVFALQTWQGKRQLPRTAKFWLLSQLLTIVAFLPWVALMLKGSRVRGSLNSIGLVTTYLKVPTIGELLSVPGHLLFNNAASFSYPSPALSTPPLILMAVWAVALALSAIGLVALRKRVTDLLLLAIPSVGALLLFYLISVVAKPIFIVRALITALPFFAILIAIGLVSVGQWFDRDRRSRAGAAIAATVLILLTSINFFGIFHGITTTNRTQWREASEVLSQQLQPRDVVVVPYSSAGEFLLYNSVPRSSYNGVLIENLRMYSWDKARFLDTYGSDYSGFLRQMNLDFGKDVQLLLLTGDLEDLEKNRPPNSRVWIVTSPGRTGEELPKLQQIVQQTKSRKATHDFFRVTLSLYE
ncbi:glycosyltransferase family 39 protein [Leptolyngbya sp. FACHB-36]|uniref:glycosyltransferase family 39 protein n=1 Tax=Leptolyngbya sp. FACHB-36 TaxID=2692808 RepID=UPI0016810651|nr:glycosyltransferase family 39 protein [Leptolyngbya sp. FACHB-36]MBD2020003.1 glycosyltransferase family 39 protein [Leptolyngbya sp. FACHB-36]